MTEQQWMASTDPAAMLAYLLDGNSATVRAMLRPSDRKLRLFACACRWACTRPMTDETRRHSWRWMEANPDEDSGTPAIELARLFTDPPGLREFPQPSVISSLLRHIIDLPFRPAWSRVCGRCDGNPRNILDREPRHTKWPCETCRGRGWLPIQECHTCEGKGLKRYFGTNAGDSYLSACPDCDRGCLPPYLSAAVLRLAQACYEGGVVCERCNGDGFRRKEDAHRKRDCQVCSGSGRIDCSEQLHDALLECGHDWLAEHFKPLNRCPVSFQHMPHDYCDGSPAPHGGYESHPKGCWAIDLMLGKS